MSIPDAGPQKNNDLHLNWYPLEINHLENVVPFKAIIYKCVAAIPSYVFRF